MFTACFVLPILLPISITLNIKDYQIAGASPEMLVNVTKGIVSTKPIAGTIGRGILEEEDKKLEQQLLNDPKERAEHTMLVDLGRNDVGKVSKFGTVEVTGFMQVERYFQSHAFGQRCEGIAQGRQNRIRRPDWQSCRQVRSSGAPKVRAMQLIDQLENQTAWIIRRHRRLFGI